MRLVQVFDIALKTLSTGSGLFPAARDVGQPATCFDFGGAGLGDGSARFGEAGFQLAFLLAAVGGRDQGEVFIDDGQLGLGPRQRFACRVAFHRGAFGGLRRFGDRAAGHVQGALGRGDFIAAVAQRFFGAIRASRAAVNSASRAASVS
jgi:hypothetical protein